MILGFLSVVGIILLFFRSRPDFQNKINRPSSPEKLFAQVILAAEPKIIKLWEEGDRFIKKDGLTCENEILFEKGVGRSYYQCQPHFWQCYWSGGVKKKPALKIDLFGQSFHVRAKANFQSIPQYSTDSRYYEILKGPYEGLNFHYGVLVELSIDEVPGMSWPLILTDTCRDVFLPERIYGYGKTTRGEDFTWDNFGRKIFIDKFYVSNQQVNEWHLLRGQSELITKDRSLWPAPALLSSKDQAAYCSFWGKRVLEAKLFDAATMTPTDQKNPLPDQVARPQTPWQRDIGKSFLGMARINPDYQLTPLDCQLAQVKGCTHKLYTTDSVTWMGMNYALGFYPEALVNYREPNKNLKTSSRFQDPSSPVHELGILGKWKGVQDKEVPVAFRCYEEVSL